THRWADTGDGERHAGEREPQSPARWSLPYPRGVGRAGDTGDSKRRQPAAWPPRPRRANGCKCVGRVPVDRVVDPVAAWRGPGSGAAGWPVPGRTTTFPSGDGRVAVHAAGAALRARPRVA